jgi:hypothetical protein
VANARILNCPGTGCQLVSSSSDCLDPGKVDYDGAPATQVALTTGTATATVQNPSQGGANLAVSKTGAPFDCGAWTTDGPGILEVPVVALDSVAGDLANVVQLDD